MPEKTTRAEWLEARKKGIGGSDVGKIMGLSKWGGPLSVYLDKTGKTPEKEMTEAMEMGIELEETVARVFCKRTGLKVARVNDIKKHPTYPWMIANVDRRIVGQNKGLECKTAHFMKADEWIGEEVPDDYYAQCQHYIEVMGWESCWIAVLVGGQSFKFKEVLRDEEFIFTMIEAERIFWKENIEKSVPPQVGWADTETLKGQYPETITDVFLPANGDHRQTLKEIVQMEEQVKQIEKVIDGKKNYFRAYVGDAAGIDGICKLTKRKDTVKVNWEALAMHLRPKQEVIKEFTTTTPGGRVLTLSRKKGEK